MSTLAKTTSAETARSGRGLIVWLPVAYVLISGVILLVLLDQLRHQAMDAGRQLIQSFAQLANEQTGRTIQTTVTTATIIESRLNSLGQVPEPAFSNRLRETLGARPFMRSIWVLDAAGRVTHGAGAEAAPDHSDRPYFRYHQADPHAAPEVFAPIRSRTDNEWLIPVAKAWLRPDGSFAGVIVVSLDPRYFARTWSLGSGDQDLVIALFRRDGILLVRSPHDDGAMGRSFANTPLLSGRPATSLAGTVQLESPVDGRERLLGYHALGEFPGLLIVVGHTVDHVLAGWRRTALIVVIGWLGASVALGGMAYWLWREWARRQMSEDRYRLNRSLLTDAVRAFPGSFRLFDREERLVLSNDVRWDSNQIGLPEPATGQTFEAMARFAAEEELDVAAVGRKEAWLRERLEQFRRGDADAEIQWRDGRWFQLLERRTSDGGTISIRLDITARKAIEEQLRQSQKMEAIGQLTGGVAHDLNNMLTVIIGNAEALLDQGTLEADAREMVEVMLRAAEGSAELTNRLLAFARRQPLRPKQVDVNAFVSGMEGLLRRALGEQVEIAFVPGTDLWPVTIDPAQLEAAILNLAINARDAMPDGGRLTIGTNNAVVDKTYAITHHDVDIGEYVVVSISDTGIGMSPETLARVFEPFFTTKEIGKGTGLGLSMVYGFAQQSGGHVTIYSEPGEGTSVRMYLPRAAGAAASEESGAARPLAHAARGETILLVEDDDLVRGHVAAQLAQLGYQVIQASDGRAAIAILSGDAAIDLLFTDMVMPGGIGGRELAEQARRLRPSIRTLFTTGYSPDAVVQAGRLGLDAPLLSKPYRLHELAERIRDALVA